MRHLSPISTGLAVMTLAASGPVKADLFHLIRWSDTGFCQIGIAC